MITSSQSTSVLVAAFQQLPSSTTQHHNCRNTYGTFRAEWIVARRAFNTKIASRLRLRHKCSKCNAVIRHGVSLPLLLNGQWRLNIMEQQVGAVVPLFYTSPYYVLSFCLHIVIACHLRCVNTDLINDRIWATWRTVSISQWLLFAPRQYSSLSLAWPFKRLASHRHEGAVVSNVDLHCTHIQQCSVAD